MDAARGVQPPRIDADAEGRWILAYPRERRRQTRRERSSAWVAGGPECAMICGRRRDCEGRSMRTCGRCGGGVIGRATQARYCSPECKKAAFMERRRAEELAKRGTAQATCGQCHKPFQAGRKPARFCSAACRQKHYREASAERLEQAGGSCCNANAPRRRAYSHGF